MLKLLRLAVTVLSLTAWVLLVALWVRSYWWADAVYVAHSHCAVSMLGWLYIDAGVISSGNLPSWQYHLGPIDTHSTWNGDGTVRVDFEGVAPSWPAHWTRVYAIWALAVLMAACAAAPWIRWRYSLRTLLIITTLLAVVLGIVVAAR